MNVEPTDDPQTPDSPSPDPLSPDPQSPEGVAARLASLRQTHRELDETIARITEAGGFNQLEVQRLKKKKLQLRDEIAVLASKGYPDIIA